MHVPDIMAADSILQVMRPLGFVKHTVNMHNTRQYSATFPNVCIRDWRKL